MDTKDVLVAEASFVNLASGMGEATFCYDAFCQSFDAIVTGVVVARGKFEDVMTTNPLFPCEAVVIGKSR
jgi:hypothetical protein